MKKPMKPRGTKKPKMSCGNGGGCSKDLFTLPFCGGKKRYPRRLRTLARRNAARVETCKVTNENGSVFTFSLHITPEFVGAFNAWKP